MTRSGQPFFAVALAGALGVGLLAPEARGAGKEEEEKNIGEFIQTATNGTTRERRDALGRLGALREREIIREWDVIPKFIEFMRDDDPRFARNAVKHLGGFAQWDRTVKNQIRQPLVKLLQDPEAHVIVRREAVAQLGRMCRAGDVVDSNAVVALVRAAKPSRDNPPEVAITALRALGQIGDARARTVIRLMLSNADLDVRDAAIDAILDGLSGQDVGEFAKDPVLVKRLKDLAGDTTVSPEARAKILEALARLVGAGIQVPGLDTHVISILRDEKAPGTVIAALRAASRIGSPKVAAVLPEVYKRFGPDEAAAEMDLSQVRLQVMETAGDLFALWGRKDRRTQVPRGTVSTLVNLLAATITKGQGAAQKEAAVALGNLYSRKYDRSTAVAVLTAALSSEAVPDDIRKAAVESLEVITGRAFGLDAERWEKWFRSNRVKLRPR